MKRALSFLIPIVFVILLLLFSDNIDTPPETQQNSDSIQGNVTRVIDGDTLEMKDGTRIRLIGVNTPEKGRPYGEEAINEMRRLVTNKQVELKFDEEKLDDYERTLAYIFVGDIFLNKHMVEKGLALVETVPPNEAHEGEFMEAEIDAQKNCHGLWEGLCVQGEHTDRCIEIAEIHYDAVGNDNNNLNDEWITLRNKCPEDIPLDGYLLKDRSASNSYFFKNVTLQGTGTLTIHSGCGNDTPYNIYWQCPEKRSSVWNNEGDQAYVYNTQGRLVATYGY